jgi:hypothetical protein
MLGELIMIKKIELQIYRRQYLLVLSILYLVLTIFMVYPFFETHHIVAFSDWSFHASRVEQIYRNMCEGHLFTFISTSTFSSTGVGSFLFYPTLFLYPWVILRFIFNPVNSFYVWYGIVTLCTFYIAHYSMKKFSCNTLQSIVFSILYTMISAHRIYLGPYGYVLGEFVAYTFLPLVFVGLFEVFCEKNSLHLGIGMALVFYSHILSIVLLVEILSSIFILYITLNFRYGEKLLKVVKILFKNIAVTVLLVLPIIIIFVENFIGKGISSTYSGISIVKDFTDLFSQSLNNNYGIGISIGLPLMIALFFGWIWIRNEKIYLFTYFCAVFLTAVSTKIFPWYLLSGTFFGIVQMPWRYLPYASLMLSVVLSKGIIQLLQNVKARKPKNYAVVSLIGLGCLLYLGGVGNILSQEKQNNFISSLKEKSGTGDVLPLTYVVNKNNYRNQFQYAVKIGETDYYPKTSLKYAGNIIQHIGYINGREKRIIPSADANQLTYRLMLKKKSRVDLPAIVYANSIIKLNNKKVDYKISKRGTPLINTEKGENKIQVKFHETKIFYVSMLITVLTWLVFVLRDVKKLAIFNKFEEHPIKWYHKNC